MCRDMLENLTVPMTWPVEAELISSWGLEKLQSAELLVLNS